MPHLLVLAGLATPWEVLTRLLKPRFRPHEVEFFGRDRPKAWPGKSSEYRDLLTKDLVKKLFGEKGEVGFCSRSGTCVMGTDRWSRGSCRREITEKTACRRQRPDMLVFVCSDHFYPLLFEKFGRCALFIRLESDSADHNEIADAIEGSLPSVRKIKDYLVNLSNTKFAPKIPMANFQLKASVPIAEDAQRELSRFCAVMDEFHKLLYDHTYVNKKRPYMKGAYMLNSRVGFQRDRLHSSAQLGGESREDGYHLLNAFHMYGLPVTPGWHFDVTRLGGGSIGETFVDALSGKSLEAGAAHVNITPCDRLV